MIPHDLRSLMQLARVEEYKQQLIEHEVRLKKAVECSQLPCSQAFQRYRQHRLGVTYSFT